VLALDSKVTREVMVCPATLEHSRTLSIREDEQFRLMTRHELSLNSIMILICNIAWFGGLCYLSGNSLSPDFQLRNVHIM
jgi:hypothetical protein